MRVLFLMLRDGARSTEIVAERFVIALHEAGVEIVEEPPFDVAIQYPLSGGAAPKWREMFALAPFRVCMARIESSRVSSAAARQLNEFDQVWLPSLWSLQAAIRSGVCIEKAHWVPYGVDVVEPAASTPLALVGGPLFLCVYANGHLRRKGLDIVLAAFGGLRAVVPAARLAVLTDRPAEVRKLAAGLDPIVIDNHEHKLPAETLAAVYRSVDAFVAPSRGGSFEKMPLEAIVHGCPVIVTNGCGMADYANERNAILADGHPVRLYADDNRLGQSMGEVGTGVEVAPATLLRALLNVAELRRDGVARTLPALGEATAREWTWEHSAGRAIMALGAGYVSGAQAEQVGANVAADEPQLVGPYIAVLQSPHESCGIREYGRELCAALVKVGVETIEAPLTQADGIRRLAAGSVVLVHYEPALMTREVERSLRLARSNGVHVVLCCHWFDAKKLSELESFADRIVLHRDYGVEHPKIVRIPLGAQEYKARDRSSLRARFGFAPAVRVITTAGFLSPWKRIPEQVEALVPLVRSDMSLLLQLLCPPHYSDTSKAQERAIEAAIGDVVNVRFVHDFLPRDEVLDRIAASDVGFLYHPVDTGSVSAATKQFASARCPLVVTGSTHDADMQDGVVVAGMSLNEFATQVVALAKDEPRRVALAAGMEREYARLRMGEIAKRYKMLFEELPR